MKLLVLTVLAITAMTKADENEVQQLLQQGNNQFTARMFTEVVKANPGKSVVLSAFSVLSPLAQLALASEGESHDELLKTIGFPNDNATKEVFSLVKTQLRSIKGVEFKLANRIYIPEGYVLNDDFATVSRDVFDSEVKNVDFNKNTETAQEINSWVEEQTNKRIKDLVDPQSLTPNTRAVLVNAIYFKGAWKNKFDANLTEDRDFHVTKEKTIKIPTMHIKDNFRYTESKDLNAKLLELQYAGQESSMLIILPNEIDGLAAVEEKLKDPAVLTEAVKTLSQYEVDVFLPRFKIETTTNLKDVLSAMDVKKVFNSSQARLNNLLKGSSDLYVSEAIQKAFIEVNEEGAEAAAANEFAIMLTASLMIKPKSEFDANHPFVFTLMKGKTVLFNGVYQP